MPQRHRPELSDSVSAEPVGTNRRTPRTFRPGRQCAVPGCQTLLSIYNGAKHCAAHNPTHLWAPSPVAVPDRPEDPAVAEAEEHTTLTARRPRVTVLVAPDGKVTRKAS